MCERKNCYFQKVHHLPHESWLNKMLLDVPGNSRQYTTPLVLLALGGAIVIEKQTGNSANVKYSDLRQPPY